VGDNMSEKPDTFESPEIIESLDELEVFGATPSSPTLAAGSASVPHAI